MSTAFSVAYPTHRSFAGHLFRPLIDPRAYLRAIHLGLMFPLGMAYFVFFVTAFAVGGSLVWTLVGPPVLFFAMFVSLYLGDMEAWMVNRVTGATIQRPPKVLEGVTSFRQKVWARVIDPSTWTGLVYEVAQFPIGIAGFVLVVTGFSVAGWFIGAPLLVWLTDEPFFDAPPSSFAGSLSFAVDDPLSALLVVPLGVIALLVTLHLVTLFSATHAAWARLMLGSRGRRAPRISEDDDAPAPPTPPVALLPPAPADAVEVASENGVEADWQEYPATAPPDTSGHPALGPLTAREREVLLLLARGYSNADICETCYISEGTVKTHVGNILSKLELRDRTQVVVFAYENGIIRPGRETALRAAVMT